MNKVLFIALEIFLGGFLVCFIISMPLIAWALCEEDKENGITPVIQIKDIGAILLVSAILSIGWVLLLPMYGLMLLEKIAGKDGKDDYGA